MDVRRVLMLPAPLEGREGKRRMTLLQCASLLLLLLVFLRPLLPPSPPPGFLDAEQTQCSLCKITRLINANKQTTALRQPQMKANLYAINRGRSSFNLPVRPARCCCCCSTPPPPPSFTACPPPPLPPPTSSPSSSIRLRAPYLSPCRVAGPGSKARKTD